MHGFVECFNHGIARMVHVSVSLSHKFLGLEASHCPIDYKFKASPILFPSILASWVKLSSTFGMRVVPVSYSVTNSGQYIQQIKKVVTLWNFRPRNEVISMFLNHN